MPLLRVVVPAANVPAALSVGTTASSLSRLVLMRGSVRWDVVRRFVPAALPMAALGAWLLTLFPAVYVELLLACFLLSNLPSLFRTPVRAIVPLSPAWLPALGATAGLLSGFTGAVGLVFNGFYRRMGLDPREIVATRAANEVLIHALKLVLYAAFGLLPEPAFVAGAIVAAAALIASFLTRRLLPLLDERLFGMIGRIAMAAAGAAMFTISGSRLADLHRAWIEVASIGAERELRLHFHGKRLLAAELDEDGSFVAERTIPLEALPADVRRHVREVLPRSEILLVEEVWTVGGVSFEIYHKDGAREGVLELRSIRR